MLYPTLKIDDGSGLDKGPNGTSLIKLGTGEIAATNDSLLLPKRVYAFEGKVLYRLATPLPSVDKFTVEFRGLVSTTSAGNTLFSNEAFVESNGQYAVALTNTRFLLSRNAAGQFTHYECDVPVELRGKVNDYAVTFDFPNWTFYVNGVQVGTVVMNYPITQSPMIFFGSLHADDRIMTSFSGQFEYLRFHDGVALTSTELKVTLPTLDRTEALSTLSTKEINVADFTTRVVTQLVNDSSLFQVKWADDTVFSIQKLQGESIGKHLTGIAISDTSVLTLNLNDGTSVEAGTIPNSEAQVGVWPTSGNGYLYDDAGTLKFLTPIGDGSIILTESPDDFTLTVETVDTYALDHERKISIYEIGYSGSAAQAATNAGVWYERELKEITNYATADYSVSPSGRIVLPVGTYYVEGYITANLRGSALARLVNAVDNTVLLKSEVGYADGTIRLSKRLRMVGRITLLESTEIKVEYSATVGIGTLTNLATNMKSRQYLSELHFYRIA